MKLTPHLINKIQIALDTQGMNQSQLASKIGYHRSHVSKMLKGEIENLSDDLVDLINDALKIDLNPINFQQVNVSPSAMELSIASENDPELSALLMALARVVRPKISAFLPQIDTKRLPKIGAEITRIAHEWEDGNDPHYSKIAVEVLTMLRKFYEKEAKNKA